MIAVSTLSTSSRSSNPTAVSCSAASSRVAGVEGLEVDRRAKRHRRLVGKRPQCLQPLAGRQHRVGRVVGPDEPAARAITLDQAARAASGATTPAGPPRRAASCTWSRRPERRRDGVFDQSSSPRSRTPARTADRGRRRSGRTRARDRSASSRRFRAGRSRRRARVQTATFSNSRACRDSAGDGLEDVVGRVELDEGTGDVEQLARAMRGRVRPRSAS